MTDINKIDPSLVIIDCERKGNALRFFLGKKDGEWGYTNKDFKDVDGKTPSWLRPSEKYYGDDWDDAPYEHNAGLVYPEFVRGEFCCEFGYHYNVIEPRCGLLNSPYCKDDMRERKIPALIVFSPKFVNEEYLDWSEAFERYKDIELPNMLKIYYGDSPRKIVDFLNEEERN